MSATTNRTVGGSAPSTYLGLVEKRAQIPGDRLDTILDAHLVSAGGLRADDFDGFFNDRRELLCQLVERAMGKAVPRDLDQGRDEESSSRFEQPVVAETREEED